jgi:hypothetical protein
VASKPFIFVATLRDLRDENNSALRIGFIAGGGFLGYTVGALRGRLYRKVLYAGLGAAVAAGACCPEETNAVADRAYVEASNTAKVAYNFVRGVQPQDVSSKIEKSSRFE